MSSYYSNNQLPNKLPFVNQKSILKRTCVSNNSIAHIRDNQDQLLVSRHEPRPFNIRANNSEITQNQSKDTSFLTRDTSTTHDSSKKRKSKILTRSAREQRKQIILVVILIAVCLAACIYLSFVIDLNLNFIQELTHIPETLWDMAIKKNFAKGNTGYSGNFIVFSTTIQVVKGTITVKDDKLDLAYSNTHTYITPNMTLYPYYLRLLK